MVLQAGCARTAWRAVSDLIQRDLDGSLQPGALAYVEFDVHVSELAPPHSCF